jgi:hypothetical protein
VSLLGEDESLLTKLNAANLINDPPAFSPVMFHSRSAHWYVQNRLPPPPPPPPPWWAIWRGR